MIRIIVKKMKDMKKMMMRFLIIINKLKINITKNHKKIKNQNFKINRMRIHFKLTKINSDIVKINIKKIIKTMKI